MKRLKIAACALLMQIGIPVITTASIPTDYSLVLSISESTVTAEQVTRFLQENRHSVLSTPESYDEGFTWICKTSVDGRNYSTTVYTDGVNIVDYEDTPID